LRPPPTPATPAAPAGASANPFAQFAPATKPIPPGSVVGDMGLAWDPVGGGGYDPQTGELVLGGKPTWGASPTVAASTGVLSGVPVVGPAILSGVQNLAGRLSAWQHGAPADQGIEGAQGVTERSQAAYPKTTLAGNVVGTVAGALPLAGPIGAGADAMGGGLAANVAANAGAGGILSGADSAARGGSAGDIATSAGLGTAIGSGLPFVGAGLGTAYRWGMNAVNGAAPISRAAQRPLLAALLADGPSNVQSSLSRLGDQGMLADAGPSFLGKAQGAALNSDDARTIMANALMGRDAGTNGRLAQDVNSAFGPAQSPVLATQDIAAQRSAVHASLPQIFANAPPVDTSSVLAQIGQGLNKAVGPEASVLGQARDYLMKTGTDAQGNPIRLPVTDAETLQNAKMALDTLIDHGDPTLGVTPGAISKSQGAVADVRKALNGALRDQVPGYADVMDRSSALAGKMDAIQQGDSILNAGQGAVHPQALNAQMQGMTPEQIEGLRIGTRGAVDRTVGLQANDLVALRKALQGEGGWNEAKLGSVFGAGPTADLANSIDANSAFRDTYQNVVQNSQTAQRTAAAAAMRSPEPSGHPLFSPDSTLWGTATTLGRRGITMLANALKSDPTTSYGEVAKVLTAQGAQRDAYSQALAAALMRRGANAATGQSLGANPALAALLMAGRPATGQSQGR
jgi:hypothetical protein